MAFLGLELNAGLAAAFALSILGVFWNYSSLPEVRWNEVTAGAMAFLAGAGLELLAADNALGVFVTSAALGQITALLYVIGGLLVLVGGLVNGLQQLQEQYG